MSKKLKMFGLVLIAVAAFGGAAAGGVQAALPEYTVAGLAAGVKAPLAGTTVVTPTGGDYTFTVPNLLRITCTSMEFDEGFIINQTDEGTIKSITFFGCSVKGPHGEATTCKVQGGTPAKNGEIHSSPVKTTLVTGSMSQHYVTFSSEEAPISEVIIGECALETKTRLSGSFVAEVLSPASGVLATNQELESNEAIAETSGDRLLFGVRVTYFDAKFDIHLASDGNWGVDW